MYLFRLMTLIYRCTTLKGKLLLHPKHHEKIESRTLDGLLLYNKYTYIYTEYIDT